MGNRGIAKQDQEFLGQLLRFVDVDAIDNALKQKFIERPFKLDLTQVLKDDFAPKPEEVEKKANASEYMVSPFLKYLTTVVIKPTTGERFLAKTNSIFQSYINSNFKKCNLNKTSIATVETSASVYELTQDATFIEILGSLGANLSKLCMTQNQVEEFCLNYRSWLRQGGHATLFFIEENKRSLIKEFFSRENKRFFVVSVRVKHDSLHVSIDRLKNNCVWNGRHRQRIVVPQL